MIEFKIFSPYSKELNIGMTTKDQGSFKEDDPDFAKRMADLGFQDPVYGRQTHSDIILNVSNPFSIAPEADAFITDQKNLSIMVKIADCQGIIIFDPVKKVLACVHSGWKGSVQNIIGKTIRQMARSYDSEVKNLIVAISPSLGPCCSEFTDPRQELPDFCHPFIQQENRVDFWSLSKKQCMDEGVVAKNIEISGVCTKCDPNFFSYRRGDTGRMAVMARMI